MLSGVAVSAAPVLAQNGAEAIHSRIDAVFNIVPQNAADLAIPLTRRALARRSAGFEAAPLAFMPTEQPGPAAPASVPRPPAVPDAGGSSVVPAQAAEIATPGNRPDASEFEEGSAEDAALEDEDVARVPRPRPAETDSAADDAEVADAPTANPEDGFELVAGAAAPEPVEPVNENVSISPSEAEPAVAAEPDSMSPAREPIVTASLQQTLPAAAPAASAGKSPEAAAPAKASTDQEDCLSPDELADADKDFARNAAALDAPGFCLTEEKFKERRRPWTIQTVDSGRPGPLWAVLHDDEDVAFDSAVQGLTTYGGVLFTVNTGGKRNQDGIDPNRNFSDEEISCAKLEKNASPRYTAAFKKLMDPARPIIALHNNFHGRVPTTGIGHVSMTTVPKKMRVAASNDPEGPLASERALVLLAAGEPVEDAVGATMESLSGKGVNVVLETVKGNAGDCSLSNYAVLSGHKRYYNVTVDHDETDKQRRIIEAILSSPAMVAAAD